ncbi:MAG: TonB-dependent receptor [Hyphomicrobiaceae bacterium]
MRRALMLIIGGAALLPLRPTPVDAQTQLPGIVIRTPSPVVRTAPAPTPPAATPAPAAEAPLLPDLGTAIDVDGAFVPVTILDAQAIDRLRAPTLGDLLFTEPGLTGSSFAPGSSRPIIRGLDNFRVRVQENGVGAHDVSALSEDHAVPIDPLAAERIEIVRGPATLRWGSQAIGGVVHATNNRIPEIIPPRGFAIMTRAGFNSVDRGRDGAFSIDAGAGVFAVHADAFWRRSGDYDTPQGRQPNSSVEADGRSFGGSLILKDGFIGVSYTQFSSLYHIPGLDAADERLRIDLTQTKWATRGEWRPKALGIEAIRFWYGRTSYRHDEIATDTGIDDIGSTFRLRQQEGRIEAQHLPLRLWLGELRGAAGLQWGDRKLSAAGEGGELLAPNRTDTFAGFLFQELSLSRRLRLQAAGRLEQTDITGTAAIFPAGLVGPMDPDEVAAKRSFIARSASLGALYEVSRGVMLRLTGQYVERAPDVAELFSKGPHEATKTFEIGDPGITRERARTIELGVKKAAGRLRYDASLYHTSFGGFIFKRLTGVKCDDDFASCGVGGSELDQIVFSQRDATFQGAEARVAYDVAPIWRGVWGIDGRYDFVHARFDTGGAVPRIPPHRLGGGLFYRDKAWQARVGVLHAFRQDRIADGETPTSGYTLLGGELSYTMKIPGASGPAAPVFTIGLKAENLLDDDVRNHVSFKKDEVLLPGRSIRIFGSVKLN